jgi:glycine cleavage system aminomethyltransferase T
VPLKGKADDFIGRAALLERQAHPQHRLVGLVLDGNEVAAHGDGVYQGHAQVGVITSATRSPLTGQKIALCRISAHSAATGKPGCWRRLNSDHLCRLNFDQGIKLNRIGPTVDNYTSFAVS